MINAFEQIRLSNITGNYIPKSNSNNILVPSNIIDSGNQLQFGITNPNAPYSGIILITSGGLVGIGKTPGVGRVLDVLGAGAVSTSFVVGSDLQVGSANDITFSSRSRLRSSANGNILLGNNAVTDFDRLQFGGTTSSFPAIVKSGNNIQIRAADSSKFASILAESGIFTNWVGANLPLNTSPISALDVTGNISASGLSLTTLTGNYVLKSDSAGNIVPSNIIDSGNQLQFGITNQGLYSGIFYINSGGNILFNEDSKYNIGVSNTSRPKIIYVASSIIGPSLIQLSAGGVLEFNGRVNLKASAADKFLIQNSTQSDAPLIQIGGTTSSFPSIARSGNNIQIRAADSSSFASLSAKSGIFTDWVGANLPLNTSPISALDVTGIINSSGITVVNNVASIGNLNLISNNNNTGVIISGAMINVFANLTATGQITAGSGFIGDSLFSNNNLVLGTQSFTGTPSTGTFTTGIVISGTQTSLFNTVNMGVFSMNTNCGDITFLELPVASGSGILSGTRNSYSFNVGGQSVLRAETYTDNSSGTYLPGISILQGLNLQPSGFAATTLTLADRPYYIYQGASAGTITMPVISTCTGRNYWIKNAGASLLITGGLTNATDGFFDSILSGSYTLASGQGGQFLNGGAAWYVIRGA